MQKEKKCAATNIRTVIIGNQYATSTDMFHYRNHKQLTTSKPHAKDSQCLQLMGYWDKWDNMYLMRP